MEAADNGLLAPELASGIARIKGVRSHGVRVGNWLSLQQAQALLNTPDVTQKKVSGIGRCLRYYSGAGCDVRNWHYSHSDTCSSEMGVGASSI